MYNSVHTSTYPSLSDVWYSVLSNLTVIPKEQQNHIVIELTAIFLLILRNAIIHTRSYSSQETSLGHYYNAHHLIQLHTKTVNITTAISKQSQS